MKENKTEIDTCLKTPEQILKNTSSQFKDLNSQSTEAILNRNAVISRQKLRERAELIIDLPSKIQESIKNGNTFPESEMKDIYTMSEMAKKVLEKNKVFSLLSFLESRGGNEPNYLDELIERLYPTN